MSYEHGATYAGSIVKSVSVENMVNQRAAVIERLKRALDTLTEARAIADAAGIGFPRLKLDENRYAVYNMLDAGERKTVDENMRKIVDTGAWRHLMIESGMRTFMDAKARKDWDEQLEKGEIPELTFENVEATFTGLHAARGEIFERGVLACFKSLSWDYKTNRPFAFGKRVVLRYIRGHVVGGTLLGYVNHRASDELDDLTRVLTVLDGKPEPDHRDGWFRRLNAVNRKDDPDAEDEYFSVKCFRNGNGHLTFKRPDLVDAMNKILAKHYPGALPHDRHGE